MHLEVFFRGENDVTELGVPQCKVLRLNEIISNGSFNFCSFYFVISFSLLSSKFHLSVIFSPNYIYIK